MITDRERLVKLKLWTEEACTCGGDGPDGCPACAAYHAAELGSFPSALEPSEGLWKHESMIRALSAALLAARANRDRWHRRAMLARHELTIHRGRPTPDQLLEQAEAAGINLLDKLDKAIDGVAKRFEVQTPDDPAVFFDVGNVDPGDDP